MADPTFAAGAPGAGVSSEAAAMLNNFWPNTTNEIRALKHMISAEAPVLFAKAAEVFISELSLRSWIHTEDNKRRTLQRNDIAMAISKFDQFDFLIDIVPREEQKPPKRPDDAMRTPVLPDQIQYYLQLAQQQAQQQAGQGANPTPTPPTVQVQQPTAPTTQIQLPGGQVLQQPVQITQPVTQQPTAATTQSQVITIQPPHQQQQQQQTTGQPQVQVQQVQQVQQQPATQVFQQVFTPSGEVQNVPIQLTPQQLQAIQMQLQGKGGNQPIIIQQNSVQPAQTAQTLTQSDQFSNQGVFQVQQIQGSGQPVYIQQTDGTNGDS